MVGRDGARDHSGGRVAGSVADLGTERPLFEMPDEVAYLNTASLGPQLRSVREAAEAALERRAAPWKVRSADWFTDVEALRTLFARLVGTDPDGVALINATSYGLAIAAANIDAAPGDRVLVIAEDYPSTVYTWQSFARRTGAEMVTVERPEGGSWTQALLAAIDERVRVVSVPNVHWTDGARIDLTTIGARAREVGACLVVDATQSLGVMPLSIAGVRPDYLVCTGYKWLLGPFSVAYLYVAPEHRDGEPIEQNWILRSGAEDFSRLVDYQDAYAPGARRFDVGQRTNFTLVPMAIAALDQLLRWGVEGNAAALSRATDEIERRAREMGLSPVPGADRGPHMLGVRLPPDSAADIPDRLAERQVYVSRRADSIRIAPHLHTTLADIDRLFAALAEILDR